VKWNNKKEVKFLTVQRVRTFI